MTFKLSRLNTALSIALAATLSGSVLAATVPAGTELAPKQELV